MKILIRKATPADIQSLTRLSFQLGYNQTDDVTSRNLEWISKSENDDAFVAEHNGQVIGWMQITYIVRLESKSFCELVGLVVDESVRGSGVGRLLVEKAIDWARKKNTETLRVRTNLMRMDAHKFYEKIGFSLTKEQKIFGMNL